MRQQVGESPVFRPGADQNVAKELARMRDVDVGADDGTPGDFRLSEPAGYLKLCRAVTELLQDDTRPVAGMYLPLQLWDAIVTSPEAKGPRGGIAVGYHNVERYLTNSLFALLVRDGWVGTHVGSTHDLTDVVVDAL